VQTYASLIAHNAPLTIRAAKAAMREWERDPADRDLQGVAALVHACFDSDDYKEGRQAFTEKRRPEFHGR
jgi:enoyl-CoA hydratase